MSIAEWQFGRLCNKVYRRVRLDFLRISILTGNTGDVWVHDEFVFGFLCTRVAGELTGLVRSANLGQRQAVLVRVLTRLLGSLNSARMFPVMGRHAYGTLHGLKFRDGVELARRLYPPRTSRFRRDFMTSDLFHKIFNHSQHPF